MSLTPLEVMERTAGTSVGRRWIGVHRTFTDGEARQFAESLNVDPKLLRLGKTLINSRNPYYAKLTKISGQAKRFWNEMTLPWIEKGIRLLLREDQDLFRTTMEQYQGELLTASMDFGAHYEEVLEEARKGLGSLWNRKDYPEGGYNLFEITVGWPNLTVPEYLSPEVFERELRLRSQQFEKALEIAEQRFAQEFCKIVENLGDRLQPNEDGTPKVFKKNTVDAFTDFFVSFKKLNFRTGSELEKLVHQAEELMSGVEPEVLRFNNQERERISEGVGRILSGLEECTVVKRRRVIDRSRAVPPQQQQPQSVIVPAPSEVEVQVA